MGKAENMKEARSGRFPLCKSSNLSFATPYSLRVDVHVMHVNWLPAIQVNMRAGLIN